MKAQRLEDWWIVETLELGSTATPGRLFAYQAAEVCRGAPLRLKVLKVRPANPLSALDALAIKQSEQELREVLTDAALKSGALTPPAATGRAHSRGGGIH